MTTQVLGICNVTPDSFSDGGEHLDTAAAVAHGEAMFAAGAAMVDVGGESTRPGAVEVDPEVEAGRILPVIERLAPLGPISVDTRHAEVARAALAAGATVINDVSASLSSVAAECGAGWICMHMAGTPATMQDRPAYGDVVREVREFLVARAGAAHDEGVADVLIDPGIGFGKSPAHNLELLAHLDLLVDTGWPVVVGTSRKSFLGLLHAASAAGHPPAEALRHDYDGVPGPRDRLEGNLATAVWAATAGVSWIRAHDVEHTVDAVRLVCEEIAA